MSHSYSPPVKYIERWLTPSLQEASRDHPIVVLTGARQVGKSTLLQNAEPFRNWRFQTMDDFNVLDQALKDPESLWAGTDRVVLDEVQKSPNLIGAVKHAVDLNPKKHHFVLCGSANLLLMKRVNESLAGRAVYFILDPLAIGEAQLSAQPDLLSRALNGDFPDEGTLAESASDPTNIIMRGLMPPLLALDTPQSWTRWWDGYVATYLERDLRQVAQINALLDFRKLMELVALRSGQLLNQSELARDGQLSQSTVHRFLNLLETTHLFDRLPPYSASHNPHLLKSPKAFLNDIGLAVFLSGYFQLDDLRKAHEYDAYFETLIYHHLRLLTRLMSPPARLYFWRTRQGIEVDFVVEHGRRIVAIQVKRTSSPGYKDTAGLRAFLSEHPSTSAGLLIHGGLEIKRLDEKIAAIPLAMLTG